MAGLKVGELGDYLREQRQSARLSLRQLAEVAGVSNPYLSQVERGLRKPSAEVLQQIAKGLRISAEALYVRAGLLEERGDRIEVEAAILSDPHLTERQRRVLLDIYETFRTENSRAADRAMNDAEIGEVLVEASPATPAKRTAARKTTAEKATAKKGTARKTSTKPRTSRPSTAKKTRPAAEGGS
ncbi:MAG: helix-turn-helix domain-containing protein [Actinomycetes bacterium]